MHSDELQHLSWMVHVEFEGIEEFVGPVVVLGELVEPVELEELVEQVIQEVSAAYFVHLTPDETLYLE